MKMEPFFSEVRIFSFFLIIHEYISCLWCRHEFNNNHGEWIVKVKPHLTRTIETRVHRAVFSPNSQPLRLIAEKIREETCTVMNNLLKVWLLLVKLLLQYFDMNVKAHRMYMIR